VRILAGQVHSTRQQVIRIDYEGEALNQPEIQDQLQKYARHQIDTSDAVIISDYNYGVADTSMISLVRESAQRKKLPLLADSRFQLSNFRSFTSATPNQDEVEHLLGKQLSSMADLENAGAELRDRLGYRALLVTRGGQGMTLLEDGVDPLHIEAVGGAEPVDVTGAGDTVMATYALALASDASFPDAARLANFAGSVVVMKRGTATVTRDELETSLVHSEA
jgi:rfaE bifunctional protein kinase chain/domain